jgi:hypothetical protein
VQHVPEPNRGKKRSSQRAHWAAVAAVVVAAVGITLLVGKASALTSVAATENVNTNIPIRSTPTSLGSVSLAAGNSYVILAKLNLRSNASMPVSIECSLSAPGDEADFENASFGTIKGTSIHSLSFLAVSSQFFQGRASAIGNAGLSCQATSSAGDSIVIAHDARIVSIPVDTVSNNLATLSRPGQ